MKIIDYVTKLTIHEEWQKLEMYQNFILSDLFIGMSQEYLPDTCCFKGAM